MGQGPLVPYEEKLIQQVIKQLIIDHGVHAVEWVWDKITKPSGTPLDPDTLMQRLKEEAEKKKQAAAAAKGSGGGGALLLVGAALLASKKRGKRR